MRQYLLMAIAGLVALIMGLFTIPDLGTGYRGQVTDYRCQGAEGTNLSVLQTYNKTANYVETFHETSLQTVHTVDSSAFLPATLVSQTAPDPYFAPAPLPLLPPEAMTEVSPSQLPPLDAGMVNVTGNVAGYRVETHGRASLQTPNGFSLALPYDPSLLPQGFTEDDIQTYVYDKQYHRWVAIQRDSVNMEELLVCSRFRPWEKALPGNQEDMGNPQDVLAQVQGMMSMNAQGEGGGDSPLDFINAVLKTPEMPETSAYTPTSIKELKAADPLEGLTLMQPPTANNSGTANMSYPIEIPAGRQGMQPNLALTYSSGGGNGWLGVGWDISIPSITVETRWGVPRYDSDQESEVYVYEGEQLVSKDANGEFRKLRHRTNEYLQRNSGNVQFWPRKNEVFDSIVRHGSGPNNYWWTVTHKNGVTDYYGKYVSDSGVNNSCVLRTGDNNTSGAIAHWALAESVDPFGNSVRYYYDIEQAFGGKQIYIDSISYTCFSNDTVSENGFYSVIFARKGEREDVVSSCNRGFKEVTASTLCNIVFKNEMELIRGYFFYVTNDSIISNFKTRLKSFYRVDGSATRTTIEEFDCGKNAQTFENLKVCQFEYYDTPGQLFGSGVNVCLQEEEMGTPIDGHGVSDAKVSALGATNGISWSAGGTASVGLGPVVCITSASVGGNFDYSRSQSEGQLTMIDLDGDGLADRVFKKNGNIYYRRQSKTDEYTFSFGAPTLIEGLSDFLKENSSTTTWGLQASAGCAYSGGWPTTKSTTSTYFADVNGDGLPDLITDDGVLFNITPKGGTVQFKSYYTIYEENQQAGEIPETVTIGSTSDCGGIIFDGEVNDSVVCRYDLELDTVVDFKTDSLVIRAYIDSLEATGKYEIVLHSLYGNTFVYVYHKVLRCEPVPLDPDIDAVKVWVAPKDGDIVIHSNFMLDIDTASEEFRQSHYTNGVRYTIQHEQEVERPAAPSFDLISHGSVELYSRVVPRDSVHITKKTEHKTRVKAGDLIFFRLQSRGNRNFDHVNWVQDIRYDGTGSGHDAHGMPSCCFNSAEDFVVSGEKFFSAYKNGVVDIDIDIHTTDVGVMGDLIINSSTFSGIYNTNYPSNSFFPDNIGIVNNMNVTKTLSTKVLANDTIAFFLNAPASKWGNIEIRPHIRYRYLDTIGNTVRWDTLDYYPPVTYFSMLDFLSESHPFGEINLKLMEAYHRYFGPLYRGWGQFGYNNNAEGNSLITDPIDIKTFHLINYDDVDTAAISTDISQEDINGNNSMEGMSDYYAANHMYNPLNNTRWIEMEPDSRHWIWKGYGNINFVGRKMMSNTRHPEFADADTVTSAIPEYDYPIPVIVGGIPKTVRKQNESNLKNHSLNIAVPIISVGASVSDGDNTVLTDYMDLNGDRYPDILGGVTVQYSTPWGGLGETKVNGGTTMSNTHSDGQTFGASYSLPKRGTSNNPKSSKISFDGAGNVGASHGSGHDETGCTFMDMNGDGLPDKVSNLGNVQLNTGYAFLPSESWNFTDVRKGKSENFGVNVGASFNVGQASIGGGVGINYSDNKTEMMLIDMNGDGLPDRVDTTAASGIDIRYNMGNGRWSRKHSCSQISQLSYGTSFSISVNASVTLGYTFFGFLKVCAGLSIAPYNGSFNKDKVQLTDINGDGYVDYVTSNADSMMTVKYNQMGKTNLLRKVTDFTGSTVELDYNMPLPTFDKPQRSWNLSEVRTFSGDTANVVGGNRALTRFSYAHPNYNRYERMDYGYDSVVTKQYNTDVSDSTLYRYTVEEFENKVFNKRGRKTRQCIYDAEGHPYIETIYDATLADMNHPDSVYGEDCPAYVFVKEEAEIRNYYEGGNTPGLTTVILRSYDNKRNIIAYTYLGDTTRTDDYFKAEIAYATGMGHNLISLPTQIEVKNNNNTLLQKRTASYGMKGELNVLEQYNSTSNADYYFTHDQYGNLLYSVLPENNSGQRLEFSYSYDSLIHSYPIRVENVPLGYYSTAAYDYRFGKPTGTVDINGNEMRYEYDDLGRTVKILAPNELSDSLPYTIRMSCFPYHAFSIGLSSLYSSARTDHYDRSHPDDPISTVLICDGWGRMLQTKKDAEIGGQEKSIVTGKVTYDCFGRTIAQYHPVTQDTADYSVYDTNYDPLTLTETHYDILDRQTKVKLPNGDSTQTAYGFGIAPADNRTCLRTTVTDPKHYTVTTLTEGRGLQMATIAPYNTVTSFVYDPIGRLTSTTDPSYFTTTYSYDMLGRMTQRTHPDAGTDTYVYDAAGNMTSHTNGKGDVVQYDYYYNQLTDVTYPAYPANNVHYTYGAMGAAHNRAGKIVIQEDASGWQEFFYGKMGEVVKNIRTFALPYETRTYTFAMEYEYDSWNRIQNMTYPDGEVVSYEYNKGGMLQRVTGQKNGQAYTYIDSLLYNKFELKERILYGNGSRSQYEYDILLRLDSLTAYDGENLHHLLQAIKYNYDAAGNITGITNSAGAVNGLGGLYHVEYSYNGLYRMTHAEGWHGSESNFYDMQMGYYPNGRIQHKKLARPNIGCRNCIGIYDNGYSYSYGNRLVRIEPIPIPTTQPGGGAVAPEPGTGSGDPTTVQINYDYSFLWDGAGNMTRQTDNINNSVRYLHWDAENRLQGVKDNSYLSLYQYDANGERTYKLTGSGYTQIINGVPTRLYALTSATLYASPYMVATVKGYTKHYYAESERIASRIGNGGLACIDTPLVDLSTYTSKLSANSAYFDTVVQNRLSAPNYITAHLLDTLYYWKTSHGNNEPDCYWYHPDHLGSASWVTDNNGEVVQYLYYLPWGEDFKNQRRNGYSGARHTFSAKEKDSETGLSYFGSRYYSSDLSIWLSVDPLSDKYPSLSPYTYCANNPIKLVDPNGEDIVITSTTDDNGNTSVHIKFTGMLVNKSSQNYTKEDLNKLKNTISNSIKEKYSGEFGDGVTVTTSVDIITEGEKKLENYVVDRDRHQINMVDDVSNANNIAEAEVGGRSMNICANIGKGDNSNDINRTAAHEFGHLLGLPDIKVSGNLMESGGKGTFLTSGQIREAVSNYYKDMINIGIPSRDDHRRVNNYAKERIRNALGFH